VIKYLLDTNVISEAIKTAPHQHVMHKLEQHQEEIATATPVWHELRYGCNRLPVSKKRSLIEAYLTQVVWQTMAIFPYDAAAADWHAEQRARLVAAGKSPSFVDGQIAAVAAVNELTLVSRNAKDYEHFTGINVQNWHENNCA
jgi:tRNA(fMet)-specific endonuclease VapC